MQIAIINLGVFFLSLAIGILYTFFCKFTQHTVYSQRLAAFKLKRNLRLITLNIMILSTLSVISIALFSTHFSAVKPTWLIFATQFLTIMLLDDMEFYFWHRFLHSNRFMMRKIHAIHHRTRIPYPIEFIYAHPLEWMGGILGLVLAVLLIIGICGTLNAYVLWAYTAYRTLRELDIHSNIEPHFFKYLPWLCNSKHHSLHHRHVHGNFASTFTYLDKLFGTKL